MFLDEVGELPLGMQAKLLRVLEEREVLRVGGLKPRTIDVRFVAATNRDLEAEVERGTFRQDLFFRLNGITLVIPPLRERPGEIRGLAALFVARVSRAAGPPGRPRSRPRRWRCSSATRWPGNIRELRNVIERAVVLCAGDRADRGAPAARRSPATPRPRALAPPPHRRPPASRARPAARRDRGARAPAHPRRARRAAAATRPRPPASSGISRRTLVSRLGDYGVPRPRKR